MERMRRRWQAQTAAESGPTVPLPAVPHAYTIAISRECGANGFLVAQAVGECLGWAVYDRELVQMLAEGMGVRTNLLEHMDERRANWLRECVEFFADIPTVSQSAYVRHLVETLLTLAAHGECVLLGRGAPQILPPSSTLRVRLVAPLAERIRVIQERRSLSPEEAARWIERVDRDRRGFVKDHFQLDPAEPHNYDLVLNTGRLPVAECAEIVTGALRRRQTQTPVRRAGRMSPAPLPV
jgi:cytidylate kinase